MRGGWGLSYRLTAGEALVRNGDLLALIVQKKERSSLFILTDRVPADMTLNAIDEVSWNREQLTRGFDKSALFLFSDRMGGRVEGGYDGDARDMAKMSLHTRGRAYCYALKGLVFHKMTVLINVPDGGVWRVKRVDLDNEALSLRRWKK